MALLLLLPGPDPVRSVFAALDAEICYVVYYNYNRPGQKGRAKTSEKTPENSKKFWLRFCTSQLQSCIMLVSQRPRGSRQISMQAWLLGSLLRGNKDGSSFCQNMIEKEFPP